jgi:hypothetical protein
MTKIQNSNKIALKIGVLVIWKLFGIWKFEFIVSTLILTKESIIEKTCSSKISPNPSFPKSGNSSPL